MRDMGERKMEEKAKVVLVMADGREVKARVNWDDVKKFFHCSIGLSLFLLCYPNEQ